MSSNFLTSLGIFGAQSTNTTVANTQSSQFQQNLQQLEQDATSNPQAAMQLLQSLPPGERHALMQALKQQDPQAAQSIHTAFQQQEQQQGQTTTTAQTGLPAMLELAQGLGKMLGGSNSQQTPPTGPSSGYSPFTSMSA